MTRELFSFSKLLYILQKYFTAFYIFKNTPYIDHNLIIIINSKIKYTIIFI